MIDLRSKVELLLNILWLALTASAVLLSVCHRAARRERDRLPYVRALLAITCLAVLLFPVVSASDDLHPTQEIFEDSSKRVQPTTAPILHGDAATGLAMVLAFLSLAALFGPLRSGPLHVIPIAARGLAGHNRLAAGRAPPSVL
jgi:hypothetical protein